jgi:hypothetical protein
MFYRKRLAGFIAVGVACALFGRRAEPAEAAVEAPATISPYCRKVRARAEADAALLRAPRVIAEGIRFPSNNRVDLGPTVGSGFQLRGALSFSPVDFYRGSVVERAGDADCRAHDAAERVRLGLEDLSDLGRLPALRAEAAYLDGHRAEWRALLAKAADQLAARLITAVEYHELRRLTQTLERKSAALAGEIDRLQAGSGAAATPQELQEVDALARAAVTESDAAEHAFARLRAIDPWAFKITGGVIPPVDNQPADWFGIAELSYSLGGFWHAGADAEAVNARADEVRHARYELPARLDDVKRALGAELSATKRELEAVDAQLASTESIRTALEGNDAPNLAHARATLTVERLDAESDRVYLSALLGTLTASVGGHDGP